MRAYLDEVLRLPRPSVEQVASFVDYVASAHSWYKHLPFFPPGAVFVFFVDPFAGYDRVVRPDGVTTHRERLADAPRRERFHYTWQPTEQYVSTFGHLNYHASAGTSFRVGRADSQRLEQDARRWFVEFRHGIAGGHPSWLREEWMEMAREQNRGRIRRAIEAMLDVVFAGGAGNH